MIKLIASDLDGTLLLNGSQQLSPRAVPLVRALASRGILFVAASGRQYPNLLRLFGEAAADMAFICENGAFVTCRGQVIEKNGMEREGACLLAGDILKRPGCEVLISGERTSYLIPKSPAFLSHMQNVVKNDVRTISSLAEIPEEIIKISAYEEKGINGGSASYFMAGWQDVFKCTVSGFQWMDFVHKSVNKGAALKTLLDSQNISEQEAIAFGDNFNDLEMLSLVKYGYVMEHAVPEIRQRYTLFTPCVEDTLEKLLSGIGARTQ